MSASNLKKTSSFAEFINRRIAELRPRRSQLELAAAAGFQPHLLSMIADGKAKLPLDRVAAMAKALECNPSDLMSLAMKQYFDQTLIDLMRGSDGGSQSGLKDISGSQRTNTTSSRAGP